MPYDRSATTTTAVAILAFTINCAQRLPRMGYWNHFLVLARVGVCRKAAVLSGLGPVLGMNRPHSTEFAYAKPRL